jgi:hypothetical protein
VNPLVTIDFAGGVAATSLVQIILDQAVIAPGVNQGVTTAVGAFTNLSVWPDQVAFATSVGGVFDGTLSLALGLGAEDPTVTLNNLVPSAKGEAATITWPTASGPEIQILTPGNPLTLSGITAS